MKRSETINQYASICERFENAIVIRVQANHRAISLGEAIPDECFEIPILEKGLRMARFRYFLAVLGLTNGSEYGVEMSYLLLLENLEAKVRAGGGDGFDEYTYRNRVASSMRLEQAEKVYAVVGSLSV